MEKRRFSNKFERGFPVYLKRHFRLLKPVIAGLNLRIGVIIDELMDMGAILGRWVMVTRCPQPQILFQQSQHSKQVGLNCILYKAASPIFHFQQSTPAISPHLRCFFKSGEYHYYSAPVNPLSKITNTAIIRKNAIFRFVGYPTCLNRMPTRTPFLGVTQHTYRTISGWLLSHH
ncbi:hypothetical protein ACFL0M_10055 [Thermodesulfobacteriota bacterium]